MRMGRTQELVWMSLIDWNVKVCNNIVDFDWDVDYDYYISEASKLVIN